MTIPTPILDQYRADVAAVRGQGFDGEDLRAALLDVRTRAWGRLDQCVEDADFYRLIPAAKAGFERVEAEVLQADLEEKRDALPRGARIRWRGMDYVVHLSSWCPEGLFVSAVVPGGYKPWERCRWNGDQLVDRDGEVIEVLELPERVPAALPKKIKAGAQGSLLAML